MVLRCCGLAVLQSKEKRLGLEVIRLEVRGLRYEAKYQITNN